MNVQTSANARHLSRTYRRFLLAAMFVCACCAVTMNMVLLGISGNMESIGHATGQRMLSQRATARYIAAKNPSGQDRQTDADFGELERVQRKFEVDYGRDTELSALLKKTRAGLDQLHQSVLKHGDRTTVYRSSQTYLADCIDFVGALEARNSAQILLACGVAYVLSAACVAGLFYGGRIVFQPMVVELGRAEHRVAEHIEALESNNIDLVEGHLVLRDSQEKVEAIRHDLARAESVAGLGSWTYQIESNAIWWSDGMYRLLGIDRTVKPSVRVITARLHPADSEAVRAILEKLAESRSPYDITYRIVTPQGKVRHIRSQGQTDEDGKTVRGTWLDITQSVVAQQEIERQMRMIEESARVFEKQSQDLHEANQKLQILAKIDSLTSLHNRRGLTERLDSEFALSRRTKHPLCVAMLDLDYFKSFNDSFGHRAGDGALIRIAEIIQGCLRSTDLAARYGGEEIALVLPDTSADGAFILCERIRSEVEAEKWPMRELTVSIGIAESTPKTKNADDLLSAADVALYQSKERGRNRITVADSQDSLL
jgi:diguanylate cyclase (GGDEF)-like protein